jgi:hypothetical protein
MPMYSDSKYVNIKLTVVLAVVFLGGPVGCNSDIHDRNDLVESDARKMEVVAGSANAKYLPILDDLLPRYYEVLGIDDRDPETSWSRALEAFKKRKVNLNVHITIESAVVAIETVLQRRLASHAGSPSNTLFMPVNLLMGLIRAYSTGDDIQKVCLPATPCRFPRQIFNRFARDIRVCIESQKHTKPSTDYYRFYRGLVDYFSASQGIDEAAGRVKAMYFLDTYILPNYIVGASASISSYRWGSSHYSKYPRDLIIIEEFIANGPPKSDDSLTRSKALDFFKRFVDYAQSFWNQRIVMDTDTIYRTREILITIKSIATDIRHLG